MNESTFTKKISELDDKNRDGKYGQQQATIAQIKRQHRITRGLLLGMGKEEAWKYISQAKPIKMGKL